MPTNLPPEAAEVESRYRAAKTTSDKIACLEEFIAVIPKHKGTDKLRADLRRRLSKLRESSSKEKKKGSRQESSFHIDKEGAGQVVVVGPTNVGKSALVAKLTHANPEVMDAPLTTWNPTPGMMPFENIQIQLVDTPPLTRDYIQPEMMELIRTSDFILLVLDLQADTAQQLDDTLSLLEEHHIAPYQSKDSYHDQERLNFIPILVLVNKYDDESYDEDFEICRELLEEDWDLLPVSVTTGRNLDSLKQALFDGLEIIRVFSKPPRKPPDLDSPFVVKMGITVEEFAAKVHQDFSKGLKSSRVWGSATHDGSMVGRDHVLQDGDVVELDI